MSSAVRQSEDSPAASGSFCSFGGAARGGDTKALTGWSTLAVEDRLRVLRAARHRMAAQPEAFANAVAKELPRSKADTIVTELLPLLDACKFLERNATRLLAPHKFGRAGRPLWLGGIHAEVHREPLGRVLVIGPANFPLFLPGAQVLQALAAGNSVVWKPGRGGEAVARMVAQALSEGGLPEGTLQVTDDSVAAGQQALARTPDKVVFTGSADTGKDVLRGLADSATPAVVELSGADAVIVMPGANLEVTAKALAFGLRLNGGQVCMSPRRLFAKQATVDALRPLLLRELGNVPPVPLNEGTAVKLEALCLQAQALGASMHGTLAADAQKPIVLERATTAMEITRSDTFAPVLSIIPLRSLLELPEAYAACPFALTVSIFCGRDEEGLARGFAKLLRAGTVLINDLIAPTADPRVPFGGRGASGFGMTRGAEGLLEMTAVKTVLVRRGGTMRHLQPTTDEDAPTVAGLLRVLHGGSWRERWQGIRGLAASSRKNMKREL